MFQKCAIYIIHSPDAISHTDPLFKQFDILKLIDLYDYQVTLFILSFIKKRQSFNLTNKIKICE